MSSYDTAIDALRDEMAKHPGHAGIAAIGEYLTERLQADLTLADRLDAGGKTLEGAFSAVRDYARKHQSGGCGFVSDTQAFAIACEYYGIPADGEKPEAQTLAPADDGLDLDALLGM